VWREVEVAAVDETRRRTLDDYRSYLPWLEKAALTEEQLRRIPVHEAPDTVGGSLALGYVSPGAPPAVPGEIEAAGTRQIFVFQREVPEDLWERLEAATFKPQPSGYAREGMFTGVPDVTIRDEDHSGPGQG